MNNDERFDSFEQIKSYSEIKKESFTFKSNRFEVWENGKLLSKGMQLTEIIFTANQTEDIEIVEIKSNNLQVNNQICSVIIFDTFFTLKDRLVFITLPEISNGGEIINMHKMDIQTTRKEKHFEINEPYACNLFLINGSVKKVTFSYCRTRKLIEFYSQF